MTSWRDGRSVNNRLPRCPSWFTYATIYDMVGNEEKVSEKKRKNRPPITDKREATHGRVLGLPWGEILP